MVRDEHRCQAIGCETACPGPHLVCQRHWRHLPAQLQFELLRAADRKRNAGWARTWFQAAVACIDYLAAREGRPTGGHPLARLLARLEAAAETSGAREDSEPGPTTPPPPEMPVPRQASLW